MRRTLGCVIMLGAVVACFIIIGTILVGNGLGEVAPGKGASINLGQIWLVIGVCFIIYIVGLILFTSIRSFDPQPRGWLATRLEALTQRRRPHPPQ